MMQRREFLTIGSSLVAATSLLPPCLAVGAADTLDIRAVGFGTGLSKKKFEALLNQTFFIHTETEGMVIVQLVRVTGRRRPANPATVLTVFPGRAACRDCRQDATSWSTIWLAGCPCTSSPCPQRGQTRATARISACCARALREDGRYPAEPAPGRTSWRSPFSEG